MLVSTVIVVLGLPGVITILVIVFSSITVCVGFVIVVLPGVVGTDVGSFGSVPLAFSSTSV